MESEGSAGDCQSPRWQLSLNAAVPSIALFAIFPTFLQTLDSGLPSRLTFKIIRKFYLTALDTTL